MANEGMRNTRRRRARPQQLRAVVVAAFSLVSVVNGFVSLPCDCGQPSMSSSAQNRKASTNLMAANQPPWKRRGREQKRDAEDELALFEQNLLNHGVVQPGPASPAPQKPKPSKSLKTIKSSQSSPVPRPPQAAGATAAAGGIKEGPLQDTPIEGQAQETFLAEASDSLVRVDRFLALRLPMQSRSALGDIFDEGLVFVNGIPARKSLKLVEGDKVEIQEHTRAGMSDDIRGEDIPLTVLYEDEHLIAINKAPGMVVHPAPGNRNGTFVNALVYHVARGGGSIETTAGSEGRPGIVHRLDKGTSGVLLAAKTAKAHASLSAAFSERRVNKTYLAISIGNPSTEGAVIDVPIGRHPRDRQRMAVAMKARVPIAYLSSHGRGGVLDHAVEEEEEEEEGEGGGDFDYEGESTYEGELLMGRGGNSGSTPLLGRTARSTVKTLAFDGRLGVVEVGIETGRTHQIRVHLQHRRNPVLGDDLYGNAQWNARAKRRWGIKRPMLHALRVEVAHPVTGVPLRLVAPVPMDMMSVVSNIWPQTKGKEEEEWWVTAEGRLSERWEEGKEEEEEEEELALREEKERVARLIREGKIDKFGWELEG
ncbi:pseudouridine family [Nannochloropsis oceanica]